MRWTRETLKMGTSIEPPIQDAKAVSGQCNGCFAHGRCVQLEHFYRDSWQVFLLCGKCILKLNSLEPKL